MLCVPSPIDRNPMRSRDLPACRTLDFAAPSSVRRTEHDGYVQYDAPSCRSSPFAHRLVLDKAPNEDAIATWRSTWDGHYGDKGVNVAYLCWEQRKPGSIPGASPLRCLMLDEAQQAPNDINVSPVTDLPALTALITEVEGDTSPEWAAYCAWYLSGLLARVADEQGCVFGWYEGDELVGMAAIFWNHREARLQAVAVKAAHRRHGIASALVTACVAAYQDVSFGITYGVAEGDGPAESVYRKLGFRRVTCFFELAV